jgi:UDPglucose--hexose-1-phosphate uridylyltransferase
VIAPGRAKRPGAARGRIDPPTPEELAACPFCEGREERTPPETLTLPGRKPPDSPGWRVRVVPNLYPAFERQEVVIHTPRHARSFADLDGGEVELVANAWRLRAEAARRDGFAYVHALINEGRDAGASLPHSHSQLVWLREPPPAVTGELVTGVPELLARGELRVAEEDGVAVLSHPAGRGPYELVVAPVEREDDAFSSERLGAALRVLAGAVARLRNVEGGVPWNAWLHTGRHWHLEVLPRLAVFAGIELGAGLYVNTLAPEEAASRLRDAGP